jgi:hypothetical protein
MKIHEGIKSGSKWRARDGMDAVMLSKAVTEVMDGFIFVGGILPRLLM